MVAAIEKGWVGVGITSPEAFWAGGVTIKWVKGPWILKGTSVSKAPGGLAGLGRFPPCCRLAEWTWQIPAFACQAKPFPMRPEGCWGAD